MYSFIFCCINLSVQFILQVVVTKVTAEFDRWTLLKSNEPLITQLQARIRGTQCRKSFLSRLDFLRAHEKQAVALQVRVIPRHI